MNKRKREGSLGEAGDMKDNEEEAEGGKGMVEGVGHNQWEGEEEGEGKGIRDDVKNTERKLLKQQKKDDFLSECDQNFKVIIDCSWEESHTDSTLKSLTQQIMYCYGSNRRYEHPSRIFVTGVGPKTASLLQKNNSNHWVGATIHTEDFLEVFSSSSSAPLSQSNPQQPQTQQQPQPQQQQEYSFEKIVYLTSDSENVLEELDSSTTYVIGGIVDRNRLKGITNKKAIDLNLRTAKLPIKEYMKMAATHVLTVNHVFDILKQFQEHKSWRIALEKVLPMRKGAQLAISSSMTEKENEEEGEGEGEEENLEETTTPSEEKGCPRTEERNTS